MDLNICLYCEKQLLEESKSFCSSTCQSNEASKPVYTTADNPSLLFISSRSTSTVSPTYEIAYRRRRYSSSYYPALSSSSSSSSSSSTCSYYSTMDHHSTYFSSHSKNVYTNLFSS